MKISNETKDAITYALLATFFVAVIMLQGCSTIHLFADAIEESRQYCSAISDSIEAYQECMARETWFLNYETERR